MDKVKRRGSLMALFAITLAMFCALLVFMIAPSRPRPVVKADEVETPDYSAYHRITSGRITSLAGKIIVAKSQNVNDKQVFLPRTYIFSDSSASYSKPHILIEGGDVNPQDYIALLPYDVAAPALIDAFVSPFSDLEGDYLAVYIPTLVTTLSDDTINVYEITWDIDPTAYEDIYFYSSDTLVEEPVIEPLDPARDLAEVPDIDFSAYQRVTKGRITNLAGKIIVSRSQIRNTKYEFLFYADISSGEYPILTINGGDSDVFDKDCVLVRKDDWHLSILEAFVSPFDDLEGEFLAVYIPESAEMLTNDSVLDIKSMTWNINPAAYEEVYFYALPGTWDEDFEWTAESQPAEASGQIDTSTEAPAPAEKTIAMTDFVKVLGGIGLFILLGVSLVVFVSILTKRK